MDKVKSLNNDNGVNNQFFNIYFFNCFYYILLIYRNGSNKLVADWR